MEAIVTESEIVGTFVRDRHGWADYHYIAGYHYISRWVGDRLNDIPDGAIIRVAVEVIDPEPEKQ